MAVMEREREILDLMLDAGTPFPALEKARRQLCVDVRGHGRGFRRRYQRAWGRSGYARISGGAYTLKASRSGLFWTQNPGGLPIVQDAKVFVGNVFFVDSVSGTDAGGGSHPDKAFATWDYAIGQCTDSQGDAIFLMPTHAETLNAAGGITLDVIGVQSIGLGNGNNRPTITISTEVLSDIEVDAASNLIKNIRFIGNIAALAAPVDVDAAGFTMEDCDWFVASATTDIDITVITDANADDMTIRRCSFNYNGSRAATSAAVTATSTECIRLVGADRARIEGCYFGGDFTTSAINGITTASLDIRIADNRYHLTATENIAGVIDLVAGCNGYIHGNNGFMAYSVSLAAIIDPSSCGMGLNYFSNVVTEAGGLVGTAST